MGDRAGHLIDLHVIVLDKEGNGIYGPKENGQMYPKYALEGSGSIDGTQVKCLSPKYQLESHAGYEFQEKDFKDVKALCEKFNLKPLDS